jgi:hypothetical protein
VIVSSRERGCSPQLPYEPESTSPQCEGQVAQRRSLVLRLSGLRPLLLPELQQYIRLVGHGTALLRLP